MESHTQTQDWTLMANRLLRVSKARGIQGDDCRLILFIVWEHNGTPIRGWNIRHRPFYLPTFCVHAAAKWNRSCSLFICSASVVGVKKHPSFTWQEQTSRQHKARRRAARFRWRLTFGVVFVISWTSEGLRPVWSSALTWQQCDIIHTQVSAHLEQFQLCRLLFL